MTEFQGSIQDLYNTYYTSQVFTSYQSSGSLFKLIDNRGQIVGKEIRFSGVDKTKAHLVVDGSIAQGDPIKTLNKFAQINSWQVSHYIEDTQKRKTINFPSFLQSLATSDAAALTRQADIEIIGALSQATNTLTPSIATSGFNFSAINALKSFQTQKAIPQLIVVVNAFGQSQILNIEQLQKIAQFGNITNGVANATLLTEGRIGIEADFKALGIRFIVLADDVPLKEDSSNGTFEGYAFDPMAVGGSIAPIKVGSATRVENYADGADYLNSVFDIGAVIKQQKGVIKFQCKNSLSTSRSTQEQIADALTLLAQANSSTTP